MYDWYRGNSEHYNVLDISTGRYVATYLTKRSAENYVAIFCPNDCKERYCIIKVEEVG